jgi:hypothetical protein
MRRSVSGLKGVTWDDSSEKWKAQIGVKGRTIYLGLSSSLREAGLTYDAAAKIAGGPYIYHLNFPREDSEHIIFSDTVLKRLRFHEAIESKELWVDRASS